VSESTQGMVEVELLSIEPSAVEAVRVTLAQLPGGRLLEHEGRYYVPAGFVAWACERQGYVKRVIWPDAR
jgi:hypothetical protein